MSWILFIVDAILLLIILLLVARSWKLAGATADVD